MFVMFGDKARKLRHDYIEGAYPHHNFTQSLFDRFSNNDNPSYCNTLPNNHRFGTQLSLFLNEIGNAIVMPSLTDTTEAAFMFKSMGIINSPNLLYTLQQIDQLINHDELKNLSVGIILPPKAPWVQYFPIKSQIHYKPRKWLLISVILIHIALNLSSHFSWQVHDKSSKSSDFEE